MLKKIASAVLFLSFIIIHAQGPQKANHTDENGLKQGYWEKGYPNGKIAYKGYFKDGKPIGKMERFYESGIKKADINFLSDGKTSYVVFYYENGGKAADGKYINDDKDSTWNYYSYYDKLLQTIENYKLGKKHGKVQVFYTTGQVYDQTNWVDGKKHGEWIQYFQNGNIKMITYYENDVLHGCFNVNSDNNEPEVVGRYENNLRVGTWLFYDEEGNQRLSLEYANGEVVNKEVLNEEQQKFFDQMEENIGKLHEPTLEDVFK